jgi:hypothetical protein
MSLNFDLWIRTAKQLHAARWCNRVKAEIRLLVVLKDVATIWLLAIAACAVHLQHRTDSEEFNIFSSPPVTSYFHDLWVKLECSFRKMLL